MKKKILFLLLIPIAVVVYFATRKKNSGFAGGGGGGIINPALISGNIQSGGGIQKQLNTMNQLADERAKLDAAQTKEYEDLIKQLGTNLISFNYYGFIKNSIEAFGIGDDQQAEQKALLKAAAVAGDPKARLEFSVGYPDEAKKDGIYAIGETQKGSVYTAKGKGVSEVKK